MRYFRNDKLDLVNREKQRFGFRKLSSGKIASVLLGVTIFGSFALNGQVVKADTTTNGSQTSAVVDEAKSTQNNEEQGATAAFNEEEQSGQDASAQKDGGSHSSLTITSDNLGGEETTEADQGKQDTQTQTADKTADTISGSEAETGKTQTDSTGTDTQNPNRGGTTSDTNSVGDTETADKKEVPTKLRALVLAQLASIPVSEQPTAAELVKTYPKLTEESAQKLLDYYNNLGTVTSILDLNATDYGSSWLEQVLQGQGSAILSATYVDTMIGRQTKAMVADAKDKIDGQIKKLTDLSGQYPNNQEIKDAIDKLNAAKDSINQDSVTNAAAMKDAIDALNHYGSQDAYNKLAEDAAKPPVVVDKDGLKSAVEEADTVKGDSKYYNATNKDAYDKALEAAQKVIDKPAATQQEVEDAKTALAAAKNALNGSATDKGDLKSAVEEADTVKGDSKYYNATNKDAYDKALEAAQKVIDKPAATQQEVEDAKTALAAAKNALNGSATDKGDLKSAVEEADTVKGDSKYYNATNKDAYDKALEAAQKVIDKPAATQQEVEDAKTALAAAKNALNGSATDKGDLKSAVEEADTVKGDSKYYNATNKDAYDKALEAAQKVIDKPAATQQEVEDAKTALAAAKNALNGSATDKGDLKSAVEEADTVKGDSKYYNATNKDAYDKALEAAQKVIDKPAATQQEVEDAKTALAAAKNALNGSATDKGDLKSAVEEADTVKGDSKYYNATNKDAYDKALEAAQKVIDKPAATQQEVEDAKTALAAAKNALNGSATDKGDLKSAVEEADTVKGDSKYYNATNKDAYDKALEAAQKVIDKPAATQQEVEDAKTALAAAKNALNGSATDKGDLKSAVEEADTVKGDSKYYNATNKDAYDKALEAAQKVIDKPAATQQEVEDAKTALAAAKNALNGSATDKGDLKSAVEEADTVKGDSKYYNATNKDAYDKALEAAQKVIDKPAATQQEVEDAKTALAAAKNALNGSATDKGDLKSAVEEADTVKGDSKYYNATNKDAYDKALEAAQKVIDKPAATQQEVEDAKTALAAAKNALNGSATDKGDLKSAVEEADTVKGDSKYYNASQDKKQAYDQALDQATKVLNNKNASQKTVDEAVANLEKAKAELNGEPNFIGDDYTPSEPSTPSTETPAEKTTEKILMHAAYLYDNKGIKIDKPTVKSYVIVVVAENPVTINGAKCYKVAGKDEYIKVDNIDGTLRVITHNSYIYNNKGKATRSKGIKRLVKKTRIVKTYGAPINIKGHMMYRIAKNRYIKARNFEGTLRRLSHNSFVYDENGKATRNKGIRRLLKKSRVVRTFDAPVKINGHMMYQVDNGYVKVKNFK